ncbi:MAG TPA: NAD+ synthase [Gammaproteobacteria bacterium]|nr:NAD+ synthase [Gammaproteobacteria bacterium]
MTTNLKVTFAQLDFLVGDIAGNLEKIETAIATARDEHQADLIVFPELTLTGYPPEDLLWHAGLKKRVNQALAQITRNTQGIDVVVGFPEYVEQGVYNACALLRNGQEIARYRKQHRPNYSVFDEKRYFLRSFEPCIVDIKGIPVALTICEDLWHPGPAAQAAEQGATLLLNISASPFECNKQAKRVAAFAERSAESGLPLFSVNLVGGQDELVFDGGAFVLDNNGNVVRRAPAFEAGLFNTEFNYDGQQITPVPGDIHTEASVEESIYQAMVLGVRDYAHKNKFKQCVLGLSGGIDSALTLAIAVDALGAGNVTAVMMPSQFTADVSHSGAEDQAKMLGVDYQVIPIEPVFAAFNKALADVFADTAQDVTEENLQARCRGVILMAISNKFNKLLLSTGNKSETAVGYATLYGDMAGGFAPLSDVFKTMVYRLARYRNSVSPAIPKAVIERAPSAELRADQLDSDSLPDYAVLDQILEAYIEDDKTYYEMVDAGLDKALVRRVIGMVQNNEYKRRQAAPGVRVSRRAFGRDRRYPITSGYDPGESL